MTQGGIAEGRGLPFAFYRKSVTRLETDPMEGGRKFARLVLDFLSGKEIPPDAMIGSTFVRGETF